MRVFVASLATETNTFSPLYVDRSAFESAFYCPPGAHPETPTLCSAPVVAARRRAKTDGFTLFEGTATWAEPAGLVSKEGYESLRDEILDQLKEALPIDVVLFGLHGSMVARGYDDCEGDLLARARVLAGEKAIIGAELDMHCHLTDQMVAAADTIITFKEFPHTDFLERAEELVELCLRAARGEVHPVSTVFDCRTIAGFMTSREPGRSFVDRIKALEGIDGILSISVAHGFQAADVYDVGTKVLVVADGDCAKGSVLAERLGREIIGWGQSGGIPRHFLPEEAIAEALGISGRPVVLADRWDNPGGGVAGDSTVMVEVLLRHPEIPAAIGAIWDPVAVSLLPCCGCGSGDPAPFWRQGRCYLRAPDRRDRPCPWRPRTISWSLSSRAGFRLGPAAAVTIGNLDVVLATTRAQTFSPPSVHRSRRRSGGKENCCCEIL